MRRTLLVFFLFSFAIHNLSAKPKKAKNVILLLADAGGVATVNAASLLGYQAPLKLFVQSWPALGLSDTSTASQWVSDSAAGMTALVTGVKTHNGVLSMGPDTERGKKDGTPLKTILEYAEEKGLSTGVLSNVTITDATPAACFSHVNIRSDFGNIFLQLFSPRFGDGVDILMGPGRKAIFEKVRALGSDPDVVAKEKGRPVFESVGQVPAGARRALVMTDGPFDLADAAKRTIETLSKNSKGYFLMIESDAHTNDPKAGLERLVAFDKLIREIAALTKESDTLLLFTADHSFGLRLRSGSAKEPLLKGYEEWKTNPNRDKKAVRLSYLDVDDTHTGEEVAVLARGPGSELVRGYMPNTQIFHIMMAAYGWKSGK